MLLPAIVLGEATAAASADASEQRTILVLGDSLSAGYGIPMDEGWVALLEQRLAQQAENAGYRYRVINASISGDTSRGARSRLDRILERHKPDVAIIELGGNDGLRGIQPDEMRRNLAVIIENLQDAGARVVLVPMKMPPNYGPAFTKKFEAVYEQLANEYDLVLSQFILHDIAEHPELMQEDGVHPTAEAQSRMLANIWPVLKQILPLPDAANNQSTEPL